MNGAIPLLSLYALTTWTWTTLPLIFQFILLYSTTNFLSCLRNSLSYACNRKPGRTSNFRQLKLTEYSTHRSWEITKAVEAASVPDTSWWELGRVGTCNSVKARSSGKHFHCRHDFPLDATFSTKTWLALYSTVLQKLTVAQLLKKISASWGTRSFKTTLRIVRHLNAS
jgi:hypothetical protein